MAGVEGVRREAADRVVNVEAVEVPKLGLQEQSQMLSAQGNLCRNPHVHTA